MQQLQVVNYTGSAISFTTTEEKFPKTIEFTVGENKIVLKPERQISISNGTVVDMHYLLTLKNISFGDDHPYNGCFNHLSYVIHFNGVTYPADTKLNKIASDGNLCNLSIHPTPAQIAAKKLREHTKFKWEVDSDPNCVVKLRAYHRYCVRDKDDTDATAEPTTHEVVWKVPFLKASLKLVEIKWEPNYDLSGVTYQQPGKIYNQNVVSIRDNQFIEKIAENDLAEVGINLAHFAEAILQSRRNQLQIHGNQLKSNKIQQNAMLPAVNLTMLPARPQEKICEFLEPGGCPEFCVNGV